MDTRNKFVNPATIAALLLFAGGSITAPAMAEDRETLGTDKARSEQIEETSKEQARQANEAAVEDAAQAVEAETRLDLDLRLIGRNSVTIAGDD